MFQNSLKIKTLLCVNILFKLHSNSTNHPIGQSSEQIFTLLSSSVTHLYALPFNHLVLPFYSVTILFISIYTLLILSLFLFCEHLKIAISHLFWDIMPEAILRSLPSGGALEVPNYNYDEQIFVVRNVLCFLDDSLLL